MTDQKPFLFDIPSVTELTGKIKTVLEQNFMDILVEGEASNVKRSANGHFYFTLKDSGAQLPCVIWRSTVQRLGIDLTDGQQIVIGGDIQVYEPHGRYQMIVNLVQQAGIGKLQQAFEKLKAKLKSEGLFDDIHKLALPKFPQRIGVVTSKTTAAFQDIRATLQKRWPLAEVKLFHASVQGVNAAPEIVNGINYFSNHKNVDVVIIGRGGGSLEDLWPFNEEAVARAVFHCEIPIISAVGHEVDFSISDFVADSRAATPTQAAVMAVPDINEINIRIEDLYRRLQLNTQGAVQFYKDKVTNLARSYALLAVQQKMETAANRIASMKEQLEYKTTGLLRNRRDFLLAFQHRLDKQNPNEPLEKGFARVWQNEKWIRSSKDLKKKDSFEIEWKDDRLKYD
ncbi:MAG TPA: exodeoxyribonuclease VII large subunit [Balneola sp.]|jgi:exodeoxyribonuclease VII large subunit|nr:exodeoxyribonuclease VII large subunit [Balneola sp.]MAC05128.1 exodeoxyribonuclease VII large subunit [Balneola sp.]MAO76750.1 exodeoxyribonuclease VII large subunit [Balneola sp.]MBF65157.1 exodeoxyribonuclease VII large subunit [Balneola sp.]HAW82327.1 exodeoxyribonuclease VII large subunit [Balneola sp.]|tara:strand:- start:3982 stop:5175 length:1194 start_codon:yes stop_codon:yes gene_type:complete